MDNFDENDEKLLIEIVLNNSYKSIISRGGTTVVDIENLLHNDNTKLMLQSRTPYIKLAFIKALKDNLLCLGYLEESIDTLNYASEDFIHSTIVSMTSSSSTTTPKKRKVITQKKTLDRSHSIVERFEHEVT
jgi:hypothetical protein